MMKRVILLIVGCVALVLFCQEIAFAHGGQYRGPSDSVPPNLRGAGDAMPPSFAGGPAAPGPAGPNVTGKGPVGRGGVGGVMGPRTARTGGNTKKIRKSGEGYERWEFWWERNKEPFLNLKNRLERTRNVSGSSGFLVGRGKKDDATTSRRPNAKVVRERIAPRLLEALQTDNADILDSAVLALARITRTEDAGLVLDDILNLLGSTHQTAQESSSLSLGVLGAAESSAQLYELMIDSSAGQRLTGKHEVPSMVRAFAALSLGLINDPGSVDKLIKTVELAPDRDRDLKVCAIVALGLMKDSPKHDKIVGFLISLLNDRKMSPLVKSAVPTALAKLEDPIALGPILKLFKKNDQDPFIRQSCATALGVLASMDNESVIKLLKDQIEHGKDQQTRHFSFIALARIGANDFEPEKNADKHEELSRYFLKNIVKPKPKAHKPWAALAGAIHAQKHKDLQPAVIEKVSHAFEDDKNSSYRGAMAIALGLLDAQKHADMLYKEMGDTNEKSLKGYLCVALGLMNHRKATETIRKIAATEIASFKLRLQAAISLGLMGDTDAVDVLVKALKEGQTLSVTSSAAKALGLVGDVRAIQPLSNILSDKKANDLARAFSAVALGIIGEKTDLPWYTRIIEHYNYRASVEAISEIYSWL